VPDPPPLPPVFRLTCKQAPRVIPKAYIGMTRDTSVNGEATKPVRLPPPPALAPAPNSNPWHVYSLNLAHLANIALCHSKPSAPLSGLISITF